MILVLQILLTIETQVNASSCQNNIIHSSLYLMAGDMLSQGKRREFVLSRVFSAVPPDIQRQWGHRRKKRQQLFPLRLTWQGNDEIKWNYRGVGLEKQGAVVKRAWRQKCFSHVGVVGSLPCAWSILLLHCSSFGGDKTSR